ncbi:ATP-binding protein [Actinokineospora sp. NBRC 105648]|uniref:NACHT domain-containing protein n=1 Tax=Actinokineospora sp. NBRC 105648 TaxID=3032206 RepID=UPI0024A1BE71|nr:ATP-binding protein [Actinokineospora sp. NBRC 105648]GLZ39760.1 hypothetical protein Acsp05_33840 [Actinokineospora sp. NBRC 105648]
MRKQPSLTFADALRILGTHEPGLVDRLDRALGAGILGAGAVAGLTAIGGLPLAPLGLFTLVWGWVDQKNEAMGLLRGVVRGLSGRLAGKRGLERRELIEAAHSVIVVAAFFEVLEDELGRTAMKAMLTDQDRQYIATGVSTRATRDVYDSLYLGAIAAPSPSRGFRENYLPLGLWIDNTARRADRFLAGLAAWRDRPGLASNRLTNLVLDRYATHYLGLATKVPEFLVWSSLGEHAATRTGVAALTTELRAAFTAHGAALARTHALLSVTAGADPADQEARSALHKANHAVLSHPVVPGDADTHDTGITFPTVEQVFVMPRYRITRRVDRSHVADERWWRSEPKRDDLDLALAAQLTAPEATRLPMLVLGHPGAGKSLLTKVLAARLPAAEYTVVRVPLRAVSANAPIIDQVGQALDLATHQRISWPRLVRESADTVRVVLLDGLDELLQAAQHDRGGYLREVAEFQRVEAEQGHPVVAVVTSRTVVADRVTTAPGTTVVKLEPFDPDQVDAWLAAWRAANAGAAGTARMLTAAEAALHPDLAAQPLLLMMLAVYAADPDSAPLDARLSTWALYGRLFDNFARREVQKQSRRPLRGERLAEAVRDQIFRLSVAALAMFNRGAQQVHEADLNADLRVLGGLEPHRGSRVLGEFFFVHAAEAVLHQTERCYEFLHATFGEYLVVQHVLTELCGLSVAAYGGEYGNRRPQDDLLFALLSHQVWTTRQSLVDFAGQHFDALPDPVRIAVRRALVELVRSLRSHKRGADFDGYRPTPVDLVRQLAVYSANLVTLLVTFGEDLDLVDIFGGTPEEALRAWRSTLALWRTLEAGSWHATLSHFTVTPDLAIQGGFGAEWRMSEGYAELSLANVSRRPELARLLRLGMGMTGETVLDRQYWVESMLGWIAGRMVDTHHQTLVPALPPAASDEDIQRAAAPLSALLASRADWDLAGGDMERWQRFIWPWTDSDNP